jgi:hypothetical protein
MTNKTVKFLPIGPLLNLYPHLNQETLARKAGLDSGNFSRTCATGRIRWDAADRAAINLGLHPILIWGDDWLHLTGQAS